MAQFRHTGEITSLGIVLGLAAGIGAALILSIPYAYLTIYIPFLYANVLCTLALGFLTGKATSYGARLGMLQSGSFFIVIGLVAGTAAVYFDWVCWIFALSRQTVVVLAPESILQIAQKILKEGTWGMGSGDVNVCGTPLLIVWIAEAGAIILFSAITAGQDLAKYYCCPKCSTWFNKPFQKVKYAPPEDYSAIREKLLKQDFSALSALEKIDLADATKFMNFDLYLCPKCRRFGAFSLEAVEIHRVGKEVEERRSMLIDREMLESSANAGNAFAAPAESARQQ